MKRNEIKFKLEFNLKLIKLASSYILMFLFEKKNK